MFIQEPLRNQYQHFFSFKDFAVHFFHNYFWKILYLYLRTNCEQLVQINLFTCNLFLLNVAVTRHIEL